MYHCSAVSLISDQFPWISYYLFFPIYQNTYMFIDLFVWFHVMYEFKSLVEKKLELIETVKNLCKTCTDVLSFLFWILKKEKKKVKKITSVITVFVPLKPCHYVMPWNNLATNYTATTLPKTHKLMYPSYYIWWKVEPSKHSLFHFIHYIV